VSTSGANGEGRTPMPLRALEPKSRASANSATFARVTTERKNYTSEPPDKPCTALAWKNNTADILYEGPSR
jgi:hypothetical protein